MALNASRKQEADAIRERWRKEGFVGAASRAASMAEAAFTPLMTLPEDAMRTTMRLELAAAIGAVMRKYHPAQGENDAV